MRVDFQLYSILQSIGRGSLGDPQTIQTIEQENQKERKKERKRKDDFLKY